jgi:hypothetical protein
MDIENLPVEILQSLVRQPSLSGQEGEAVTAAEAAMKKYGFDKVWRGTWLANFMDPSLVKKWFLMPILMSSRR